MDSSHEAAERLQSIDALQDELLQKLAELELRTAAVLAECLGMSGLKEATTTQLLRRQAAASHAVTETAEPSLPLAPAGQRPAKAA